MQVKHSKTDSQQAGIEGYLEFKRAHRNYVRAYRKLHAEVAAFSILPEKFIAEAEPVIEQYLEHFKQPTNTARQRQQLQVITGFINKFHELMDEATEMFNEHQALSNETFGYLKKVIAVEETQVRKTGTKAGADYHKLVPELLHLRTSLKAVKTTSTSTARHLESLTPIWERIRKQLNQ